MHVVMKISSYQRLVLHFMLILPFTWVIQRASQNLRTLERKQFICLNHKLHSKTYITMFADKCWIGC